MAAVKNYQFFINSTPMATIDRAAASLRSHTLLGGGGSGSESGKYDVASLLKDAPSDSIRQRINVEREEETIEGPLSPSVEAMLNNDVVSEKVDLDLVDGQVRVTVCVRCERTVPLVSRFTCSDTYKKSSVIVTRTVRIDMTCTENRQQLYESLRRQQDSSDGNGMRLGTRETFQLYKGFMGLVEASEAARTAGSSGSSSRGTKGPPSILDEPPIWSSSRTTSRSRPTSPPTFQSPAAVYRTPGQESVQPPRPGSSSSILDSMSSKSNYDSMVEKKAAEIMKSLAASRRMTSREPDVISNRGVGDSAPTGGYESRFLSIADSKSSSPYIRSDGMTSLPVGSSTLPASRLDAVTSYANRMTSQESESKGLFDGETRSPYSSDIRSRYLSDLTPSREPEMSSALYGNSRGTLNNGIAGRTRYVSGESSEPEMTSSYSKAETTTTNGIRSRYLSNMTSREPEVTSPYSSSTVTNGIGGRSRYFSGGSSGVDLKSRYLTDVTSLDQPEITSRYERAVTSNGVRDRSPYLNDNLTSVEPELSISKTTELLQQMTSQYDDMTSASDFLRRATSFQSNGDNMTSSIRAEMQTKIDDSQLNNGSGAASTAAAASGIRSRPGVTSRAERMKMYKASSSLSSDRPEGTSNVESPQPPPDLVTSAAPTAADTSSTVDFQFSRIAAEPSSTFPSSFVARKPLIEDAASTFEEMAVAPRIMKHSETAPQLGEDDRPTSRTARLAEQPGADPSIEQMLTSFRSKLAAQSTPSADSPRANTTRNDTAAGLSQSQSQSESITRVEASGNTTNGPVSSDAECAITVPASLPKSTSSKSGKPPSSASGTATTATPSTNARRPSSAGGSVSLSLMRPTAASASRRGSVTSTSTTTGVTTTTSTSSSSSGGGASRGASYAAPTSSSASKKSSTSPSPMSRTSSSPSLRGAALSLARATGNARTASQSGSGRSTPTSRRGVSPAPDAAAADAAASASTAPAATVSASRPSRSTVPSVASRPTAASAAKMAAAAAARTAGTPPTAPARPDRVRSRTNSTSSNGVDGATTGNTKRR